MIKIYLYRTIFLLFMGCSIKQPNFSNSATILLKTPTMKFYDTGFIYQYDDYTKLQIFNVGNILLELDIYKHKICMGVLKCISSKKFNKKHLSSSYKDDFLKTIFDKKDKIVKFKDKKNQVLIKIYR